MPNTKPKVILLRHTFQPEELVAMAAKLFMPVWLAIALVNMWVGVTKAGYSVREELPILAVVFAVPAALALLVAWRVAR